MELINMNPNQTPEGQQGTGGMAEKYYSCYCYCPIVIAQIFALVASLLG